MWPRLAAEASVNDYLSPNGAFFGGHNKKNTPEEERELDEAAEARWQRDCPAHIQKGVCCVLCAVCFVLCAECCVLSAEC